MIIMVPFLPPATSSPNIHVHWSDRSPAAREFRDAVRLHCIDERNRQRITAPLEKPVMNLTFIFKERRRRDKDNLRSRFKPGQDGIVDAELLVDDNPEHLITGEIEILVDKERAPLTIIELIELKNGG